MIRSSSQAGLIVAMALVVAGCSRQDAPVAPVEKPVTADQVSRPGSEPPRHAEEGDQGLPSGISLPFRHEIRTEKVLRREGRDDVRRVDVEYLEGDQLGVYDQTARALTSAGFKLRARNTTSNGYIRASFAKSGYGAVVLIVTPTMGDMTPRNAAAIGRVVFDLPPPKS